MDWNQCHPCVCEPGCRSKPIRLRGLKSGDILGIPRPYGVEAYTASWIEIFLNHCTGLWFCVEAYTASWIEMTNWRREWKQQDRRSLYGFVDWNSFPPDELFPFESRSLYGFVDWNSRYTASFGGNSMSKPIRLRGLKSITNFFCHVEKCRSLYGFVDWNSRVSDFPLPAAVEAYTASWIEIILTKILQYAGRSKPIRLRWLKSGCGRKHYGNSRVEAYTASWIEIVRSRTLHWCKLHIIHS